MSPSPVAWVGTDDRTVPCALGHCMLWQTTYQDVRYCFGNHQLHSGIHTFHHAGYIWLTMHSEHAKEDKKDSPIMRPDEAEDVGKERLPQQIVKEKVAGLCQCERDHSQ